MNYREKKIKEFRENFVYPGSLCGQEFLVGVTVENLEAFLLKTIEECRGFVPPEDPTDLVHKDFKQGSRGYNRCREIILNKFEGKEEG